MRHRKVVLFKSLWPNGRGTWLGILESWVQTPSGTFGKLQPQIAKTNPTFIPSRIKVRP